MILGTNPDRSAKLWIIAEPDIDYTPISKSNALHRTPPASKPSTTEDPITARPIRTHPSYRDTSSERSSVGLTYTPNDYTEDEFEPLDPIWNVNSNIRTKQAQRPRAINELGNLILLFIFTTFQPYTSAIIPPIPTSAAILPITTSNPNLNFLLQALQSISQPIFTSTSTDTNTTIIY
jgi:hypothetical protein